MVEDTEVVVEDLENRRKSMKERLLVLGFGFFCTLIAPSAHAIPHFDMDSVTAGLGSTLLYGSIGVFMMFLCFKAVDLMTPGDLKHELVENKNIAMAIVLAGHLIAIGLIISAAISG